MRKIIAGILFLIASVFSQPSPTGSDTTPAVYKPNGLLLRFPKGTAGQTLCVDAAATGLTWCNDSITGFAPPTGLVGNHFSTGSGTTVPHANAIWAFDSSIARTMLANWNFTSGLQIPNGHIGGPASDLGISSDFSGTPYNMLWRNDSQLVIGTGATNDNIWQSVLFTVKDLGHFDFFGNGDSILSMNPAGVRIPSTATINQINIPSWGPTEYILKNDVSGNIVRSTITLTSLITGAGTNNTYTKWTSGASLGNSKQSDDGTTIIDSINIYARDSIRADSSIKSKTINATTGYQVNAGANSGHVLRGNGTNFVDAQLAYTDLSGAPTVPVAGNPSGLIGLSATNGSAATWERSDATHAIDLSIAPRWTVLHQFHAGIQDSNLTATAVIATNVHDSLVSVGINSSATKEYLQQVSSGAPSFAQVAYSDLSGTPTIPTVSGVANTIPKIASATSLVGSKLIDNGSQVTDSVQLDLIGNLLITSLADIANSGTGTIAPLDVRGVTSTTQMLAAFGLSSTDVAANAEGIVYLSTSPGQAEINSWYLANGSATLFINNAGYNHGTTQYRNLQIEDGKGNNILTLTAASKAAAFAGAVDATTGYTQGGSAPTENVLLGNGTNFVSGSLLSQELTVETVMGL